MQFDDDMDAVYYDWIKSPLVEKGYTISRADDPSDR